jgi:uncharacterized damage-inducible protein DinB
MTSRRNRKGRQQKMTPAERESLLKNLTQSHQRFLRLSQSLSRDQLHYRPAPDRWTVAECLEHITIVEKRVFDRIEKTLQAGPDPSKRSVLEGQDDALVAGAVGRLTRLQAPDVLVPTGRCPDDQLLNEFESARQRTREFATTTQADLRQHFFAHPVFGDLDLYQWLLLTSAHCDRHCAQSEEVLATPGCPNARQANAPA